MFFSSYILPIFDYADIIWGDRGNVALMDQLHVPQNKAARVILDYPLVHLPLGLEINVVGNCSQEDFLSITPPLCLSA